MTTAIIPLRQPVTVDGVTHAELTMRRCKVRDRLVAARGGGSLEDKEVRLFANLCEVAPAVLEELFEDDYEQLQRAYLGFIDGAGATSAKPS